MTAAKRDSAETEQARLASRSSKRNCWAAALEGVWGIWLGYIFKCNGSKAFADSHVPIRSFRSKS
jgi:hypothetical protein